MFSFQVHSIIIDLCCFKYGVKFWHSQITLQVTISKRSTFAYSSQLLINAELHNVQR